ncbi:MAG: tripartite tricarboxylate transporter permease [Oceanicoccus sp.]|uniref:tripartite tricarboxylate transporter permease n=1 Tax=Oceanicoccus sp. TaxID=2691044 RepID=UPI0026340922|nr:tripartite tricarboxylate transporter permease [Oceanicoccus sp.]MCP3907633.1 tripartite tricarboxylate transporter permease [Oceanicoccus sp.]
MIEGILTGLATAFTPINLMMVLVGCFAGTFIGMLPGLGPVSAIALMIPITYGFDPASGMILMAGVYYGAVFGGSTSAILINAPGVSGAVATAFDGHPMAKNGMAGKALALAAYSSFFGGTIGAIFLFALVPVLASVSLSFQSADYFALMLFGCTAIAAFSGKGQILKAILMTLLGLMLATVGEDPSGIQRFTFGMPDLYGGISFLLLSMATFALAEALLVVLRGELSSASSAAGKMSKTELGSLKLTGEEVKDIAPAVSRSSVLGFFVGILPGAGATIASFLAYGMERNLAPAKKKEEFGKGSARGLAAPETANNAASTGSFVPLLTLGIPGSATTAVMLGALLSYGVQPGPRLYIDHPSVFWAVIISMYLGNIILLVLNLPLIPYISKLLEIPRQLLTPIILFFSLIGVYLVSFNTVDLTMMVAIGVAAVMFRVLDFPLAPLLLGFILGGMLEDNLRRALLIWDGSWAFLWERPITATIMVITLLTLILPLISSLRDRRIIKPTI